MKDSQIKYTVYLKADNVGTRPEAVFRAMQQTIPAFGWTLAQFEEKCRRCQKAMNDNLYIWHYLTRKQFDDLNRVFDQAGASLTFREVSPIFLFPLDRVDNDHNAWYSSILVALGEDALDDWAQSQNINEAYRFTMLPTFEPATVVRVWENTAVRIEGAKPAGFDTGPANSVCNWPLTPAEWQPICHMMADNGFWRDLSWNTLPEAYHVLDGTIFIFEGYRHGEYKVLTEEGDEPGSAYRTANFFMDFKQC